MDMTDKYSMLKHYLLAIESPLTEGMNYLSMFNDLIANDDSAKAAIEKYITWARSNLKKNDRIVWFLRWARVELAGRIQHADSDTELARLNKRLKTSYSRYDMVPVNNMMTNLSHFLSMPIDGIQKTVWDRQSPQELLGEFREAEHEWRETSDTRNLISYQEGEEPTIILKFPDGFAWFDLEKSSCRAEGAAMGHCGNTATNGAGDTVLSLRKLAMTMSGETHWYPVLTFILDGNGQLGEMKGRGNEKPADKYHPYIVALLRLPLIQGIKGGGYMPEHNFSMNDLDDDTREQLLKEKPDLGGVWDLYMKEGMSQRVLDRVSSGLSNNDLSMGDYDATEKRFAIQEWSDFDRFLRNVYDDDVVKILQIAKGEADFQHESGNIDTEFAATLLELPDQWKEKIAVKAGLSRIDDAAMNSAARRLGDANDDLYQIFQEVYNGKDGIREQAWERLYQYAEAGWTYACSFVYDDIPTTDEKSFREFVESDQPVNLYIGERDMVGMASATDGDDDDEYGSDLWRMRADGNASWETLDTENLTERRREQNLIGDRRREGDKWLAGVSTDTPSLVEEFLTRLQGQHHRGRINDPRQQDLNFESMRRHMILASRLF
jgi:hypothetical protein